MESETGQFELGNAGKFYLCSNITLSNRYFSSRYKGRTICLYEQGTAAIALLPALVLVKAEWRPVDLMVLQQLVFYVRRLPILYM